MSGRVSIWMCRLRVGVLVAAAVAATLLACGAWRGAKPLEPGAAPAPSATEPGDRRDAAVTGPLPPAAEGSTGAAAPAPERAGPPSGPPAAPQPAPGAGDRQGAESMPASGAPPAEESGPSAVPPPADATLGHETAAPAPPAAGDQGRAADNATAPSPEGGVATLHGVPQNGSGSRAGHVTVARLPDTLSFDDRGPYWAREREELVYRIEFLGMTMGYARFVFNGKVLLDGREVYHLRVRAWTANVLALIYPINDTIDYYMDVKTLVPLRQEYTSGNRKKDDVATYDQESGRIVYRYKASGEIRKQVNAVPNVYDPVTLAYFLRSRDPVAGEKGRNVYAGRKVWEISALPLGVERIATSKGEIETFVIRPLIKRDGKVEDKGDLRMWMTRDERKVPVRVYAKFRKIRMWTLVGELMPERKGG